MARYRPQSAVVAVLTILGMLLALAACDSPTTAKVSPTATPTATATLAPTSTATLIPTPSATNTPIPASGAPAGWKVLSEPHFSLAYPPSWVIKPPVSNGGAISYYVSPPTPRPQGVSVTVSQVSASIGSDGMAPYCNGPGQQGLRRVKLAGIAMAYEFGAGEGADMRVWTFVNDQRVEYSIVAYDAKGTSADQSQDNQLLATFRPDNSAPWKC